MDCSCHFDNYEVELRLKAIVSLLHNAERNGLRISRDAQDVIENECLRIFEHDNTPIDQSSFAALLKDTAVRMFRQRRYVEANVRYRMASRFNPEDATLVSNRATCLYNLKKFEKCVDVCYACMMSFPSLLFENTTLYLKLIVRLGHANIELMNYKVARKVYKSLQNLRNHLQVKCGIDIENEEFTSITMPFQRHLEAALDVYQSQNPGKPLRDICKGEAPFELGIDGYLHENLDASMDEEEFLDETLLYDEDSDDEEEVSDGFTDSDGMIDLGHLCCHVWSEGEGPCQHTFPEEADIDDTGRRNGWGKQESDSLLYQVYDEEEEEEEGDLSETDDEMPELLSSEPDDDDDETDYETDDRQDSNSDGNDVNAINAGSVSRSQIPLNNDPTTVSSSNRKETLAGAFTKKNSSHTGFAGQRQLCGEPKSVPQIKGFKKGFLNTLKKKPKKAKANESTSSASSSPGTNAVRAENGKAATAVALYETDDEDGPAEGLSSPGAIEDAVSSARRVFSLLHDDDTEHVPQLTRDIFGDKFSATAVVDSIDFVGLFGEHQAQIKSGKKKKRGCDKRCGPCFARKLWRLRFINRTIDDVDYFLDHLEEDPRLDQDTFLGQELWQSIGYYGSGHELAFDVPAIVHGVAYIALLQSELRWRGDAINPAKDVQQIFLTALENNLTTSLKGINFLFMIIFMLRDTITLFDVLSDHKSRGLTCSFQFSRTATEVSKNLRQSSGPHSGSLNERQANLMTRYDDCAQNLHNWSVLEHVEKEEVWVYMILLKNVTSLLENATSRITAGPRPIEQVETFTEAFRRLCGDRSDDESLWKHSAVSVVCKQRCRVLERSSASRKAVDLSRSATLLTRAMAVRPNQPRLYYKRADVFAHQEKWGDCVRDLQKTRLLLGEQITVKKTVALLDPARRLLLLHAYTLEGEAYSAQARNPSRDQRTYITKGIELISKALEVNPKSRRTKTTLQKKLKVLQGLENELSSKTNLAPREIQEVNTGPASAVGTSEITCDAERLAQKVGRRFDTTAVREKVSERDISLNEVEQDASSDEEPEDHVVGNPYAALLGAGASSSSQPIADSDHCRHPRNCELCDVVFWSEADYTSHINGKRHKSMINKARQRGLIPEADGTYSAPGSRLGPTRNEIVQQTCRILASHGGHAKLSEILNRLNFRRWKIRDAGSYVKKNFGGILAVCVVRSDLFQVGAGSSIDPVLRLKNGSASVAGSSRRNRTNGSTARAGVKPRVRLSETGDFSQIVTDLLKIEGGKAHGEESDREECGICLDNEPDIRCWPCGHVWCDQCMELYSAKKGTKKGLECPMCRGTIEDFQRITVD